MSFVTIALYSLGGLFGFLTLWFSFYLVEQQTVKIVQRLGKFASLGRPGLNFKIPWLDWVSGKMNLRIMELNVPVETKTSDDVFVTVKVGVQFHVLENKVYEAFYRLNNAGRQIESYVFDVVRARVPTIKLDDVFEKKDDIADAVKRELSDTMDEFGYGIVRALVTDIDPDAGVKAAMNRKEAAKREREAAMEEGEAGRILAVKKAEADKESKRLQGEGIAEQRIAIARGLKEAVETLKNVDVDPKEALTSVFLTQYFDTLQHVAGQSHSNVIMMNHSPGGVASSMQEIQQAITAGTLVANGTNAPSGNVNKGNGSPL